MRLRDNQNHNLAAQCNLSIWHLIHLYSYLLASIPSNLRSWALASHFLGFLCLEERQGEPPASKSCARYCNFPNSQEAREKSDCSVLTYLLKPIAPCRSGLRRNRVFALLCFALLQQHSGTHMYFRRGGVVGRGWSVTGKFLLRVIPI